ncbi:helix-turn-helix domain-containing protein [Bombilactobacillus bombi]|uniref:helix-turn-helix domain-containing protein n=1 Tax=Bombilactobacillus bombi TaxID=1303590 RepID=UPI0015E5D115|nr:helix-turn-helix transcriptional regulator [Bombilactobacillus bombi]MBA1433684.1 XRE family transcriptional regulator [Bombilactobacillus bombi]
MTIGQRIKELRQAHNLTQYELGRRLNITKSTVSMWERGDRTPDIAMIIKIANFFKVSSDYLLGLTPNKNPLNSTTTNDLGIIIEELLEAIEKEDDFKFWNQPATQPQVARLQTALHLVIQLNQNDKDKQK